MPKYLIYYESMDPKQNLNPELRQLYEKIMSTPTKQGFTQKPQIQTPSMTSKAQVSKPIQPPSLDSSVAPIGSTIKHDDLISLQPFQSTNVSPSAIPTPPLQSFPEKPLAQTSSSFFTSMPPRPLKNTSDTPFIYTNSQRIKSAPLRTSSSGTTQIIQHTKSSGGGISGLLVACFAIVFVVAYTFFWMVFFGYIDKTMIPGL